MKEEKEEQLEEKEQVEPQQEETATEAQDSSEEEVQEEDPMEVMKAEVQESKDKYLRLYSEFENFRRRTSKEKLDLISTYQMVLDERCCCFRVNLILNDSCSAIYKNDKITCH